MRYLIGVDFQAGPDETPMEEWTREEVAAHLDYYRVLNQELVASGELIDTTILTGPDLAKVVRSDGRGAPVVTDGPYPETQEVLAGYTIVDCVSFDRATEIAAGLVNPDGDGEYVDVRPILDGFQDLEA